MLIWRIKQIRGACPKFRHPTLNLEIYNCAIKTKFVAAVGMPTKKWNHHSNAETNSKLTVHSQLLQYYFSRTKILTWQVNDLTLDRVSELWAYFPGPTFYRLLNRPDLWIFWIQIKFWSIHQREDPRRRKSKKMRIHPTDPDPLMIYPDPDPWSGSLQPYGEGITIYFMWFLGCLNSVKKCSLWFIFEDSKVMRN